MTTDKKMVGKQFQNLMTDNLYRCVEYDGEDMILEGIGRQIVTFKIPLHLAALKYRNVKPLPRNRRANDKS